jgi:hypothetical protein
MLEEIRVNCDTQLYLQVVDFLVVDSSVVDTPVVDTVAMFQHHSVMHAPKLQKKKTAVSAKELLAKMFSACARNGSSHRKNCVIVQVYTEPSLATLNAKTQRHS